MRNLNMYESIKINIDYWAKINLQQSSCSLLNRRIILLFTGKIVSNYMCPLTRIFTVLLLTPSPIHVLAAT